MSSCCNTATDSASHTTHSRKHPCPGCASTATEVGTATLLHHLKAPWQYNLEGQQYYFCDSPDCEVVYFNAEDETIKPAQIRDEVGQKHTGPESLLCYCFGVTYGEAKANKAIKDFVVQQTRQGSCACDSRNPSGRCCLKDFPK